MAWAIEYTDTALRQLGKLDRQSARRIVDYLETRVVASGDPRSVGKALTGPLGGLWRYRIGDHRVICEIVDSALRVLVVRMGDRKEVYRG